jgi:sporulation protein YlmC with PRC-barrel domain
VNHPASAPVLTALVLSLLAGAAPAFAQTDNPGRLAAPVASTVDFRSSHWLGDRKVVNNNGEEIASVSDLILDRGSGRIAYAVIKTGTTFGMGGRAIAIPYASLRWDTSGKDRFILASTPEQLKQLPEFTVESWKALMDTKKDDRSELRQKLMAEAASPSDPYAGDLDTAKKSRVSGEITKVERTRTSTFGEQVVISVLTPEGATKKIALGPSWYINSAAAAPMRGDTVVVETLALPRDPDQLLAGTHLKSGDRELQLRDTSGSPVWALPTVESGGRTVSTLYSRYLLQSHLPGMKVDCRGNECGKVADVIVDRNSGEIGFLSIDPNQNFLGIGDSKRLIPWSVATVALDGTVRLDASKEMVLASPQTPSDTATLNSGTHAELVYEAFNVPTPRFQAGKPVTIAPEGISAWSARGPIVLAIEPKTDKTFSGKVTEITEVKFTGGAQTARALKVHATDGSDEVILLGPVSYLDHQKPTWQTGDTVKIEACRTTVEGHAYWLARSIDCKETRAVLLDGNNTPAWAQP